MGLEILKFCNRITELSQKSLQYVAMSLQLFSFLIKNILDQQ